MKIGRVKILSPRGLPLRLALCCGLVSSAVNPVYALPGLMHQISEGRGATFGQTQSPSIITDWYRDRMLGVTNIVEASVRDTSTGRRCDPVTPYSPINGYQIGNAHGEFSARIKDFTVEPIISDQSKISVTVDYEQKATFKQSMDIYTVPFSCLFPLLHPPTHHTLSYRTGGDDGWTNYRATYILERRQSEDLSYILSGSPAFHRDSGELTLDPRTEAGRVSVNPGLFILAFNDLKRSKEKTQAIVGNLRDSLGFQLLQKVLAITLEKTVVFDERHPFQATDELKFGGLFGPLTEAAPLPNQSRVSHDPLKEIVSVDIPMVDYEIPENPDNNAVGTYTIPNGSMHHYNPVDRGLVKDVSLTTGADHLDYVNLAQVFALYMQNLGNTGFFENHPQSNFTYRGRFFNQGIVPPGVVNGEVSASILPTAPLSSWNIELNDSPIFDTAGNQLADATAFVRFYALISVVGGSPEVVAMNMVVPLTREFYREQHGEDPNAPFDSSGVPVRYFSRFGFTPDDVTMALELGVFHGDLGERQTKLIVEQLSGVFLDAISGFSTQFTFDDSPSIDGLNLGQTLNQAEILNRLGAPVTEDNEVYIDLDLGSIVPRLRESVELYTAAGQTRYALATGIQIQSSSREPTASLTSTADDGTRNFGSLVTLTAHGLGGVESRMLLQRPDGAGIVFGAHSIGSTLNVYETLLRAYETEPAMQGLHLLGETEGALFTVIGQGKNAIQNHALEHTCVPLADITYVSTPQGNVYRADMSYYARNPLENKQMAAPGERVETVVDYTRIPRQVCEGSGTVGGVSGGDPVETGGVLE